METAQVVLIRLPAGDDLFRWGSGYLVAPGVVLTAAHVVRATDEGVAETGTAVQVREWDAQEWRDGAVAWVGTEDVALIRAEGCGPAARPPRWGRRSGTGVLHWSAIGFPHASVLDHQRQPEQVWGATSAVTDAFAGLLGLTVASRNAREGLETASGWVGISGAAVFSGTDGGHLDHLVGVVTVDKKAYLGALEAVRVETFIDGKAVAAILGAPVAVETLQASQLDASVAAVAIDLRPGPPLFEGRTEELAALDAGGPLQVLTGLGGVGKTALAARWARHHSDESRDVDMAWWFPATDRAALATAMAARYRDVTGGQGSGDPESDAQHLVTWLSNSPSRWLVVFDDATGPADLDGLIPRGPTGRVLITSSFTQWAGLTSAVQRLAVLPMAGAVTLLAAAAGQPADEECAELASALGCLPLALVQAGAYLRALSSGYARYRTLLAASLLRVLGKDLAGTGQTVQAVLQTSMDRVIALHGQLSADLISVLSWYAPDAIPRKILDSPAIDGQPLLAQGDPVSVDEALAGLTTYSLVTASADNLAMHPLIAELIRAQQGSGPDAQERVAVALRLLDRLMSISPTLAPSARVALTDRLMPHVLAATGHAVELGTDPLDVTRLLTRACLDRMDTGQFGAARGLLAKAEKEGVGKLPDAELLATKLARGRLMVEDGQARQAVAVLSDALDQATRLPGVDYEFILSVRFAWAQALRRASRPDLALPELEALEHDQERAFGAADRRTLATRHELGFMAADDSADSAVAALTTLLADEERDLGADDPETLQTRAHVAFWMFQGGHGAEAIKQMEALVTDCQRALGIEHAQTLAARTNLVNYRGSAGDYAGAIAELRDVLAIRDRVLGSDDADTVASHFDLAYWEELAGDYAAAITGVRWVVEARTRLLGPADPLTQRASDRLAALLSKSGGQIT